MIPPSRCFFSPPAMALDSAVFSSRTVLSGFSDRSVLSGLSDAAWSGPAAPRVPSAAGDNDAVARIWAFLFSRTERPPIVPLSTASVVPGKLFHYKASHFGLGTAHAHLGEGACYRVDKRELSPTQGGFVVAVKTPKLQASASVSSQQQAHAASLILRELQVLTYPPLHLHPNIASILGYSSELIGQHAHGLSLSLVVDLASHGTLKDFLARPLRGEGKERHSLKTKVRLLHDVASGLHALHACGIVQADVKTENVLVFTDAESAKDQTSKAEADEDDGESSLIARLSDFGYAIPVEQESGTQRYMGTSVLNAPEVQRNSQIPNGDLWKCDVFSFALLVWETALDGKRYFSTSASTPIKGQSDVMEWLAGLPRDDLLRLALKSLQDAYGPSEPPLMAILQRVLKSSLRDEKDRRRPMSEIVNIFRRQRFLAAAARSRDARMQFKPEPFSQNQPSSVTDTKSEVCSNRLKQVNMEM
ncbi:kinase-like protein [Decorospora gaudefroyi]|uniref:Kinase-like protein n=1 Tax=Decorospora gaudefroyi TaxID=184978 RepID=A0A6A5K617_9PLEO|nr:kinase-like protein [Decorospora gaudefroyi]